LNREAFERKISDVLELIEFGNMKEALRKVKTLIDKGGNKMHQVERLSYRVVEMYVYEKSNRKQEAVNLGDEIIKEILDTNVNDQPLLDMLD
jgi:hypothetical protein